MRDYQTKPDWAGISYESMHMPVRVAKSQSHPLRWAILIAVVFLLMAVFVTVLREPNLTRKAGLYLGDKNAIRYFYQGRAY
jgi:hypothetical protein